MHIDVDEAFVLPGDPKVRTATIAHEDEGASEDRLPLPVDLTMDFSKKLGRAKQHPSTLKAYFRALDALGIGQVTFFNLEGVTEDKSSQINTVDYFKDIVRFKRHRAMFIGGDGKKFSEKHRALERRTGYTIEWGPQLQNGRDRRWFLGYEQGKSAARPGHLSEHAVHDNGLSPSSPLSHVCGLKGLTRGKYTPDLPIAYVLHYINTGLEFWRTKYEILGRFPDGFFDNPMWHRPGAVHVDSRNALLQGRTDPSFVEKFYRQNMVLPSKEAEDAFQLDACMLKTDSISNIIRQLRIQARLPWQNVLEGTEYTNDEL